MDLLKKMIGYVFSTILGAALIGCAGFLAGSTLEFAINLICPPEETCPVICETTESATEFPEANPPREIVVHGPDGDQIYEDEIVVPEPFYYDEYGARYLLVEGTLEEYYMDEDYREEIETLESTAFTWIVYHHFYSELMVQFRNSGAWYIYYDVEPEVWNRFKHAESKGGFFNEFIKGCYEYDRY